MSITGDRLRNLETLEDPKPALATARHLALPMLRGMWNFASVDNTGAIYDMSEQDRTLTYNGNPVFDNNDLVPYATLDGVGDYFSRADEAGLDITGTETYVEATKRGVSLGGWFYLTDITASRGLIGKWASPANRSYLLWFSFGALAFQFSVSAGGAVIVSSPSTVTPTTGEWHFIAGTFDPSATMNIYVGNVKTTLAAGVPANAFSGNGPFEIGSRDGGLIPLIGSASYCWLCASFLSDAHISGIYQNTRALFGV